MRTLPVNVSGDLLRSLTAKELILVAATYGLNQVADRLRVGDDDLSGWQVIVDRIAQLEDVHQKKQ